MARRDRRLVPIYLTGLLGAFVGRKLAFLFAEGWQYWRLPVPWLPLLTGKSVLGALPGGYAGVEFAKARLGYRERTGRLVRGVRAGGHFAGAGRLPVPGLLPGARCERAGVVDAHRRGGRAALACRAGGNGCSTRWRWLTFWVLRRAAAARRAAFPSVPDGVRAFRFFHEFARDTPRFLPATGALSGYQVHRAGRVRLRSNRVRAPPRRAADDPPAPDGASRTTPEKISLAIPVFSVYTENT